MALAYNKPRAATVLAESTGVLLSLDAQIFRRVIAQSARSRYDDIFDALKKVTLLWDTDNEANSNLNEQQLAKIAEIVEVVHHDHDASLAPRTSQHFGRAARLTTL